MEPSSKDPAEGDFRADPSGAAATWAPRLKALADENRLTLALLIAEAPRTVKELEEATGMSQTLVSYHLKPLRDQGLVTATAEGRSNRYDLCCGEIVEVVAGLSQLANARPVAG